MGGGGGVVGGRVGAWVQPLTDCLRADCQQAPTRSSPSLPPPLQDLSRAWTAAEGLHYGMVGVNEVAITSEVGAQRLRCVSAATCRAHTQHTHTGS